MKKILALLLFTTVMIMNLAACTEEVNPSPKLAETKRTEESTSGLTNNETTTESQSQETVSEGSTQTVDGTKTGEWDEYIRYYEQIKDSWDNNDTIINQLDGLVPPIGEGKSYMLAPVQSGKITNARFMNLDSSQLSSFIPHFADMTLEPETDEVTKTWTGSDGENLFLLYTNKDQKTLRSISYNTKRTKSLAPVLNHYQLGELNYRRVLSLPSTGDLSFKTREEVIRESEEILRATGINDFQLRNCYSIPKEIAGEEVYYLQWNQLLEGIPFNKGFLYLGDDIVGMSTYIEMQWDKDGLAMLELSGLMEMVGEAEKKELISEDEIRHKIEERINMSISESNLTIDCIELVYSNNQMLTSPDSEFKIYPYYVVVLAGDEYPSGDRGLVFTIWTYDATNGEVVW